MNFLPYQLLVIDNTTHSLLLIDNPHGNIIAQMSYPSEYTPTDLRLAPDHKKAYLPVVGKQGTGALFVANLNQRSLYRLPVEIPAPIQCTLSPDGLSVYFADPSGMLYALDIPTMSLKNWGTPATKKAACVGLAADSDKVYSVWEEEEEGFLAIFSVEGQFIKEYKLTGIPTNITLDGHGRILVPFTTTHFTIEGALCFSKDIQPDTFTMQSCIYPYTTSPSPAYPSHITPCTKDPIAYIVNEENSSITVINMDTAAILRHMKLERSISCLHILPGDKVGIATSHIFSDLSIIDLQQGTLLARTDTKRELLGYLAIIPLPS